MKSDERLEKLYRERLKAVDNWDIWRSEGSGDFILGTPDRETIFANVSKNATPGQINQVLIAYQYGFEDGLYAAKEIMERDEE